MQNRPLNLIYTGMLTKDGYFEAHDEKTLREFGGRNKKGDANKFAYHHTFVFRKLSKKKNWEDIYFRDDTLRFARKGKFNWRNSNRDNFTIAGLAAKDPFLKKSYRQIRLLAKKLIDNGINPNEKIEIAKMNFPKEEAPYQGKIIGSLQDFIKEKEEIKCQKAELI